MSGLPKVVCIFGLTGVGKSNLALALGQRVSLEVINCDSRQVYQDFPIITAQPSAEEQSKLPHWLYGFLPTTEKIDAGRFASLAADIIVEVKERGHLPLLVGGTGLYFRALLHGLAPIPPVPAKIRSVIQTEAREQGLPVLYRRLQAVDPEAAARIHPNDRQRVTRAMEVYAFTGKPISWWQTEYRFPEPCYQALKIGLKEDWSTLVANLELRIEQMLAQGAEEEAKRAWDRCPDPFAPAWSGIGCAELLQYLQGRLSLEEAVDLWKKNTRKYAKRQLTWFKRETDVHWFTRCDFEQLCALVEDWLHG